VTEKEEPIRQGKTAFQGDLGNRKNLRRNEEGKKKKRGKTSGKKEKGGKNYERTYFEGGRLGQMEHSKKAHRLQE